MSLVKNIETVIPQRMPFVMISELDSDDYNFNVIPSK